MSMRLALEQTVEAAARAAAEAEGMVVVVAAAAAEADREDTKSYPILYFHSRLRLYLVEALIK